MKPNDWSWCVCYEFVHFSLAHFVDIQSERAIVCLCVYEWLCSLWVMELNTHWIHFWIQKVKHLYKYSRRWFMMFGPAPFHTSSAQIIFERILTTMNPKYNKMFCFFFLLFWKWLGASTCFLHVYSLLWFPFIQIRFLLCSILYKMSVFIVYCCYIYVYISLISRGFERRQTNRLEVEKRDFNMVSTWNEKPSL